MEENSAFFRIAAVLRIKAKCVLKAKHALGHPVGLDQGICKFSPGSRVVGFELDRVVEDVDRFRGAALLQQDIAQIGQEARFRSLADGAGDPFDGGVVLLGLERKHAKQVQCICVIGIYCERCLATNLSVKESTR
jgi:hypothetical protein